MIPQESYRNARDWLASRRQPLLLTHRRPDGDALGAMVGLALASRTLGLAPRPTLFEPLPARYGLWADVVSWDQWHPQAGPPAGCDAVVILDTCARAQLEPAAAFLESAPPLLVIDHHVTGDGYGQRPDDLRLIDPTAGAASLLVAEWVRAADIPLTIPLAEALFTGIATDCGWFRFSNTDARLLGVTAELVAAGAEPNRLFGRIFEQEPLARLRLVSRVLAGLSLELGGRVAVMTLRDSDFEATGADRTMTEDIVNEAGRLGGVEVYVLLTEEPEGVVRVNLRSRNVVNVATVAAEFGGGGHARAAGVRLTGSLEAARATVLTAVAGHLDTGA